MPEPLDIRRLRYRAYFDDAGVSINNRPRIRWSDIKAIGVDYRVPFALPYFGPMIGLTLRRCMHVCVIGEDYPVAVPAVALARKIVRPPLTIEESDALRLREQLGDWLDAFPVVCPPGELGMWWVGHGGWSPGVVSPAAAKAPTPHERVEKVEHELHDLQDQLRRIQARKDNGHPPA